MAESRFFASYEHGEDWTHIAADTAESAKSKMLECAKDFNYTKGSFKIFERLNPKARLGEEMNTVCVEIVPLDGKKK